METVSRPYHQRFWLSSPGEPQRFAFLTRSHADSLGPWTVGWYPFNYSVCILTSLPALTSQAAMLLMNLLSHNTILTMTFFCLHAFIFSKASHWPWPGAQSYFLAYKVFDNLAVTSTLSTFPHALWKYFDFCLRSFAPSFRESCSLHLQCVPLLPFCSSASKMENSYLFFKTQLRYDFLCAAVVLYTALLGITIFYFVYWFLPWECKLMLKKTVFF